MAEIAASWLKWPELYGILGVKQHACSAAEFRVSRRMSHRETRLGSPLEFSCPRNQDLTPPLTKPDPWEAKAVRLATAATVAAMPFLRRDDWIGWIALLTLGAVFVGTWGLLIRRAVHHAIRRWRDWSASD